MDEMVGVYKRRKKIKLKKKYFANPLIPWLTNFQECASSMPFPPGQQ